VSSDATSLTPAADPPAGAAGATAIACRALDVVLALVLLVLLAPVMLVVVVAIRLETPGSPLFRQRRVGHRQRPFTINKFRTMYTGTDHEVHRTFVHELISGQAAPQGHERAPMFKLAADERVTRVGAVLRRTSLDELPQLVNVVLGEMSLVGPRPPLAYEVEQYPPDAFERFAVKPGLTGLWQVSGRCELTFDEMIALDVDYARRRSLLLNLWILARTLPVVVLGRGAA
jgi:lipopolysaccharide/colanic/teichoic acid biosynthesis glycosyltransferase